MKYHHQHNSNNQKYYSSRRNRSSSNNSHVRSATSASNHIMIDRVAPSLTLQSQHSQSQSQSQHPQQQQRQKQQRRQRGGLCMNQSKKRSLLLLSPSTFLLILLPLLVSYCHLAQAQQQQLNQQTKEQHQKQWQRKRQVEEEENEYQWTKKILEMTEKGFQRCRISMYIEDKDQDWFLKQNEYIQFLNRLSEDPNNNNNNSYDTIESYTDLSTILQNNYDKYNEQGRGIFVDGAFLFEQDADQESTTSSTSSNLENIRSICIDTYKALDDTYHGNNHHNSDGSNIFSRSNSVDNNYSNNKLRGNVDHANLPSLSSSKCTEFLKASDKNENQQLEENEYPYLLSYISSNALFIDQSFNTLQERLQTNFNNLKYNDNDSRNNDSIDISGIDDGDDDNNNNNDASTIIKTEHIRFNDWVCQQTSNAIRDVSTIEIISSTASTSNLTKNAFNELYDLETKKEKEDNGLKSKVIKFLMLLLFIGIGLGVYFYFTTNEDGIIQFARIKKKIMGIIITQKVAGGGLV